MGRDLGILNISANFEPQIAAPFDSRTVVDTYTDLIDVNTFISTDGNSYAYLGLVVSVVADPSDSNNGVYLLKAFPTTLESSWVGLGKAISGTTPEYSDSIGYLVGDVISFISPNADLLDESNPLKYNGLYECLINTTAGENPEIAPNKWRYLGKVGETSGNTLITNIIGLQEELDNRVRYTDIADNLKVGSDKKVKLDVTYLTVSDYSPVEDVVPTIEEVQIGGIIWKINNESWTDGGTGIVAPRFSDLTEADPNTYGYLYNQEALQRLLTANPGYRVPSKEEVFVSLEEYIIYPGILSYSELISLESICKLGVWRDPSTEPGQSSNSQTWIDGFTNSSELSIVAAGRYVSGYADSSSSWAGNITGISVWLKDRHRLDPIYLGSDVALYSPSNPYSITSPALSTAEFDNRVYFPVRLIKDI